MSQTSLDVQIENNTRVLATMRLIHAPKRQASLWHWPLLISSTQSKPPLSPLRKHAPPGRRLFGRQRIALGLFCISA